MAKVQPARPRLLLPALAACLAVGGAINLFAGLAAAQEGAAAPESQDGMALLSALKQREADLAAREAAIATREQAVVDGRAKIEAQLAELQQAEQRLDALVARVDTAAEGDVAQLTSVYAAMKPKDAGALFSEMPPEFAAGFLGAMKPDQAAAIMANIDPKIAYGFSVLLAGRNAHLRDQATAALP
ncbi:MotE family protein [Paracoccus sp. p3-h83]|uniref:MotE family protein n=1 Tax=Paracoccus sp. p3-h83 TaxID=3342805 RepID=UPI0035BB3E7B